MTRPTALIAEDEPLLAQALQAELARAWPELQVLATVGDGASALQQALALRPDVLFLDIRMPGQSGLEAAAALIDAWDADASSLPALVFVTAYDQYAVQAFETQAVDYLLKPVQPARLDRTVQRLRTVLAQRGQADADARDALAQAAASQLGRLLAALEPAPAGQTRLRQLPVSQPGSDGNTIRMVPVQEVLFLQAADKYVRVVTATREHLLRTPLKEVLAQLDPDAFWQVHRGTVVRADAIASAQRDANGRLHLHLRGSDETLVVSRLHAHRFKAL